MSELQQVMAACQEMPVRMIILMVISCIGGYWLYVYSFRITIREKKSPFPFWLHCFYLAHDLTGVVIFGLAAYHNNWFWAFTLFAIGLFVWNWFEVFNIYMGIKHERQEIWGDVSKPLVSVKQAVTNTFWLILLMFAIINIVRIYMQDDVMWLWFSLTNFIIAIFPGFLWQKRGSREGSSVGLAILIVFVVVNTFLPTGFGLFTTAYDLFRQPWFYLAGAIATGFSIRWLVMMLQFEPKKAIPGQKKPIW